MVGMLIIVFYTQSIQCRYELRCAVAVGQTACYPFVHLSAVFLFDDALIYINHLLRLCGFLHRSGNNTAGNLNAGAGDNNLICQCLNLSINALLLFNRKATDINLAEGITGDNADFVIGRTDYTNINGILRNKLTSINNAARLQRCCRVILRISRHGAGKLLQLGNCISQLVNSVSAGLRCVAVVSAFTGNLNAIFGIALALSNNAPVRTGNVHDNRKVGLL